MINHILTIADKKEEKFLRRQTQPFDHRAMNKKELQSLILKMKKVMKEANGIGLSANQIGLDSRFFVALIPTEKGGYKFYSIFNPKIEKYAEEGEELEEGCLSVPGSYGPVIRSRKIVIIGTDGSGKSIKIKAWGLLARVFQHEIDHLDGKLFIDKARYIQKITNS